MQGPLPLPRVADNAIPNNWHPSLPRSLDVPSITDMVNIPRYIRCCDARDSIENTPSQKLLSGKKKKKNLATPQTKKSETAFPSHYPHNRHQSRQPFQRGQIEGIALRQLEVSYHPRVT